MASIVKRGDSYRIVVSCGRGSDGQQKRHTMTWRPPEKMTKKQIERELTKISTDFEQKILYGIAADNRQTLGQYANYVIDLKERTGCKKRTIVRYRELMKRIEPALGHLKLQDVRPQHLNQFYENLSEEGIRSADQKATPKKDIKMLMKERKLSAAELSRRTGIAASTFAPAIHGKTVSRKTADAMSDALGINADILFEFTVDKTPLSPKTIVEYHRLLSTIFSQAQKELLITFNPASLASPPKLEKKEVEFFEPDEVDRIMEALQRCPIKWQAIIHLLIVTGCRRGEIAGLKWDAIDWSNNRLRISDALLYTPELGTYNDTTKTSEIRYITVPPETMELLKEYRAWHDGLRLKNGEDRWIETGYVFTRDNGGVMNPDTITQWCSSFSRKYDLPPIHPHKFRHTSASLLIDKQMPITAVAKRLGHKSTSTTLSIYGHALQRADNAAADLIADTFLKRNSSQKNASGYQS